MIDILHFTGRRSVRLTLVALLTTFTGCEIGLHVDGLYNDGDDGADEGEGGPPDMCFAAFDGCMADAGEDPEAITLCHDALLNCLDQGQDGGQADDGPLPDTGGEGGYDSGDDDPLDGCEEELQLCLENSPDPMACFVEYEACIGEPPPPDACEAALDMCLQGNPEDPDPCFQEYELCIGEPPPPDACELELELCIEENPDLPELCFMNYEACVGEPPPDDCQGQLDLCLEDNPMDPDACFLAFEMCNGEPPVDECQAEFADCVQNAYTDEDLQACDEQMMSCLEQY